MFGSEIILEDAFSDSRPKNLTNGGWNARTGIWFRYELCTIDEGEFESCITSLNSKFPERRFSTQSFLSRSFVRREASSEIKNRPQSESNNHVESSDNVSSG